MNSKYRAIEVKEIKSLTEINSSINRFIKFLDVAPLTVQTYTSGIKQFFSFVKSQGTTQPTRETVLEFKKALTEAGRKSSTIALYLAAVKRFFSWTEVEGLYPNITVGVKAPKIDKGHKKDAFNGEQVKEIMQAMNRNSLEGLRNFAMLGLITTTGLRTIEVVRANIEDLRLVAGEPVLYVQGKGKTDKAAYVKLTPKVLEALRAYLAYLTARGKCSPTEPLFASCSRRNYGKRLTTRTISGVCKKAFTDAGYVSSRLTAHSLRHTAITIITIALMNGQSLQEVQAFARHSSMNTTLVYAHNVNRMRSLCESIIERAIF